MSNDPAPEGRAALDALLDALMHYGGTFNRKQGFQDGWAAGRAYERDQAGAMLTDALDELEGLAIHMNTGPIGSVSEWRYLGRDAARIALDKVGVWRAALAQQTPADPVRAEDAER
jgi:hypothetical protein